MFARGIHTIGLIVAFSAWPRPQAAESSGGRVPQNASVEADVNAEQAHFAIQADFKAGEAREKVIYGATIQHSLHAESDKLRHTLRIKVDSIQGGLREMVFVLAGDGEIRRVTGQGLEDWSVRQASSGARQLVLHLRKQEKGKNPVGTFSAEVIAETVVDAQKRVTPLSLTLEQPSLGNGQVRISADAGLDVRVGPIQGLVPVEPRFLLDPPTVGSSNSMILHAFRFLGTAYAIPLEVVPVDPEARRVVLKNFRLIGQLGLDGAAFTLTATARVQNPVGASIDLLTGGVALTEIGAQPGWHIEYREGRFVGVFEHAGDFAVRLKFNAAVRLTNGWSHLDFSVAPSALPAVTLAGWGPDTQFRFADAARPVRSGELFAGYLPPDGHVLLDWKEKRIEAEGALFFSVEQLSQVTVGPGLMRELAWLDFKVMQGEMNRVSLILHGDGEVTRVQGAHVLSWAVEPIVGSVDRRLNIQLNQAEKDQFPLQVQTQTPLGAFPQATNVLQLRPEGATRFGGYYRIVNDGAVRLEVLKAGGLSQISPEQFPPADATRSLFSQPASQVFAYRFSGGDVDLRIQADNILPELAVSQIIVFHLGETELAIDADIEIDIREAPLRELALRVPAGYAVARLSASGMSDYFVPDPTNTTDPPLRIIYGTPVAGRQTVQLRLERNGALGASTWVLPRVEVVKARSTRGHIGITADAGFRLSTGGTPGLTEIATGFFPKKVIGLQAAFRLNDPSWQATLAVERVPQSIQADALHLFTVGEGIAFGSTLVNYVISGAPVSAFRIGLTNEYMNVEFTGRDVRSWQRADGGYVVQLHTPVSGSYTLLATYERPFKAQGETLRFNGAEPLDVQSEHGYSLVVSTYQFQVKRVNVSSSLVPLEPGEVPAEYRLFFDAPILAAYRYSSRPFNLQLELLPLTQGETLGQVVDRAALTTRVSREGQVITDARYFLKNKGAPNIRLLVPDGTELWSVTVNGKSVVPVTDGRTNLVPLLPQGDPNAVQDLEIKIASHSKSPGRLTVAAPAISAPILLSEWRLEPDAGRALIYRGGTLTPELPGASVSGFAVLLRMVQDGRQGEVLRWLGKGLALMLLGISVWRYSSGGTVSRFGLRHVLGGLLGLIGFLGMAIALARLSAIAASFGSTVPPPLRFIAAIQQANSLQSVNILNTTLVPGFLARVGMYWPAWVALILGAYAFVFIEGGLRRLAIFVAWFLVFWSTLRAPNGAPTLFVLALAFVLIEVVLPLGRRWWQVPRRAGSLDPSPGLAATVSWMLLLSGFAASSTTFGLDAIPVLPRSTDGVLQRPVTADSAILDVRVQDGFVYGTSRLRWQAIQGQTLPLLHPPGVLTRWQCKADAGRLVQLPFGNAVGHGVMAEKSGMIDIELDYQLPVISREQDRGFALPVQHALVNRMTLVLAGLEADVNAPDAVSVLPGDRAGSTNSVFHLVLAPVADCWIGWKPRSRDTRREKAVFYAELSQLYVPGAGVVEGLHQAQIRPAQGELSELVFEIPGGMTITDVVAPVVSLWRYDPVARRLRVGLSPAQSRAFPLLIQSQTSTGPLPLEHPVGLISVSEAAGQVGRVGVATGGEVQLDDVRGEGMSPINLEDFPVDILEPLRAQIAGLTVRRAYRYSNPALPLVLKASAVESDVRVESQQTLSLGEDRNLLVATFNVSITRAGVFKLSFPLPTGLDVESISGPLLSHWTELKTDSERIVTLHLKGRTDGAQVFHLSLSGPGLRSAKGWAVPRLIVREASKQRGQLVVVPEQGLRLQVATRDGVTQLDPVQAGVRQKGVAAFRLLQADWSLTLDLERVDAWTQVSSLQHLVIDEAQVRVAGNLLYEIENAGVKSLSVRLPGTAEGVRFRGEQVADFLLRSIQTNAAYRDWEIRLARRTSGKLLLQVTFTQPLAEKAPIFLVQGIEAQEVNLQRGFLTLQAGNRLQANLGGVPAALQPAEWQSIPRTLQKDLPGASADHTFRLVEPTFQLPLTLERHDAAKLLPARVNSISLTSVVSDDGAVLTRVELSMIPGDQQQLHFRLPEHSRFWFAFVGQKSVWPWREADQILIPLDQHSRTGEPLAVELFYASNVGGQRSRSLDLSLLGPEFDLPLENISWRVFLNEKWRLKNWGGSLQLQEQSSEASPVAVDLDSYVRSEAGVQTEKTREAEQFLSMANSLLEKGDPERARRAFQNAYGLSQHDNAFNEDARVQLHNLKTQQALVGLNVRQARGAGETSALANTPRSLRDGRETAYTQLEAKQLFERNSAEDNAVQTRLVERLIQQQEATVANPSTIRASVPELGRSLIFTRSVQVETKTSLRVTLQAAEAVAVSLPARFAILTVVAAAMGLLCLARRWAGQPA